MGSEGRSTLLGPRGNANRDHAMSTSTVVCVLYNTLKNNETVLIGVPLAPFVRLPEGSRPFSTASASASMLSQRLRLSFSLQRR
jgi:hypothetical protein